MPESTNGQDTTVVNGGTPQGAQEGGQASQGSDQAAQASAQASQPSAQVANNVVIADDDVEAWKREFRRVIRASVWSKIKFLTSEKQAKDATKEMFLKSGIKGHVEDTEEANKLRDRKAEQMWKITRTMLNDKRSDFSTVR